MSSWELYDNGATVVQQRCTGSPEQLWADVPLGGGHHRFVNGRCLDVRGGSLQVGAVIQLYRCASNNPAQLWTIT